MLRSALFVFIVLTIQCLVILCQNCPSGFQGNKAVRNKCFRIISNDYGTWEEVKEKCSELNVGNSNATLAIINSNVEQAYLVSLLSEHRNFWIGLRKVEDRWTGKSTFKWVDGTEPTYTNWGPGFNSYSKCGYLDTLGRVGHWATTRCDNNKAFICQTIKDKADQGTESPPLPTEFPCPNGYFAWWKACYKVTVAPTLNWESAQQTCQAENANLASVHSDSENDAVFFQAFQTESFWIGAKRTGNIGGQGEFKWVDGFPPYYTNWEKNFPSRFGKCVFVTKNNTWVNGRCDVKRSYVCKITDTPIPTIPSNITGLCPPGRSWKQFGAHCYKTLSFHNLGEGIIECQRSVRLPMRAFVVSIHSEAEQRFVTSLIGSRSDGWLGLTRPNVGQAFKWLDGSTFQFENWATDRESGSGIAAFIDNKNSPGLWRTTTEIWEFSRKLIVCKTEKIITNIGVTSVTPKEPTPAYIPGECPTPKSDWSHYSHLCYNLRPDLLLTWDHARKFCQQNSDWPTDTELPTIATAHQNEWIRAKTVEKSLVPDARKVWLGLYKTGILPNWRWTDNSTINYLNFDHDQAHDIAGVSNCAYMRTDNGLWYHARCDEPEGLVCQAGKDRITTNGSVRMMTTIQTFLICAIFIILQS